MILVTGALSQRGLEFIKNSDASEIVAYDNFSAGFERKNLLPKNVEFIFGDIRDEVMLRRVIKDKNISAIYHFAKVPEDQSIDSFEVNLGARLKLRKIASELKLELF